jgi:hypothetical protein
MGIAGKLFQTAGIDAGGRISLFTLGRSVRLRDGYPRR